MRLETERLVLRPPRADDLDAVAAWSADPEVMRFIGPGTPWSRDRAALALARWTRFWDDDGFGLFVVEAREGGGPVGGVGLLAWDPEAWRPGSRAEIGPAAEIEIGWTLARGCWGRGYAAEAARAVRDWALGELGMTRLVSLIQPGNERSIRVALKLGERHERDVVTAAGQTARLYALER